MTQTETYFDNGDLLAIVDDGKTYAVVLSTLTDDYAESDLVLEDTPSLQQATRTYWQTISESGRTLHLSPTTEHWIVETTPEGGPTSLHIQDWAPTKNMSHQPTDNGWLGSTNGVNRHALGRFDTLARAQESATSLGYEFRYDNPSIYGESQVWVSAGTG